MRTAKRPCGCEIDMDSGKQVKECVMQFSPANDRGFLIGEFKDQYGLKCTLQKSSLATADCIWLGVHEVDAKIFNGIGFGGGWQPFPIPSNVQLSTRMHLTRKMVADLLPALQHFVETGDLPGHDS